MLLVLLIIHSRDVITEKTQTYFFTDHLKPRCTAPWNASSLNYFGFKLKQTE
jgi:hypothetical protein